MRKNARETGRSTLRDLSGAKTVLVNNVLHKAAEEDTSRESLVRVREVSLSSAVVHV